MVSVPTGEAVPVASSGLAVPVGEASGDASRVLYNVSVDQGLSLST